MPIVFDEVVGEIEPEPVVSPAAEAEPAAGGDQQIRTLIRALAAALEAEPPARPLDPCPRPRSPPRRSTVPGP